MHHQPYLFLCESPLHVGTGTEASDYIDNRIQRDVVTQYPKVEGSGLRGALREAFERRCPDRAFIRTAFGPAPEDTQQQKGALKLTSLHLLLFPVATPKGTNVWVTCRRVLESFRYEFAQRGQTLDFHQLAALPTDQVQAVSGSGLLFGTGEQKRMVLMHHALRWSELRTRVQLNGGPPQPLTQWLANLLFPRTDQVPFFNQELAKKIVVVSDNLFGYLVRYHTDVHTGNRINHQTGVVDEGKLFTTEYLPHFSVLSGWVETWPEFTDTNPQSARQVMDTFRQVLDQQLQHYVQVGGKASIGKGVGRMILFS